MTCRISSGLVRSLILVAALFYFQTGRAAEWVAGTIQEGGSPVHRQANDNSEVLGNYPSGANVRVYSEPRNGYYSIRLKTLWKGAQFVWVPESKVTLKQNVASRPSGGSILEEKSSSSTSSRSVASEGRSEEKKFTLTPSLGMEFLSYSETTRTVRTLSETLLAIKLDLTYAPSSWIFRGDLSYDPAVLSNSLLNSNIQFLRGSAGAGYRFTAPGSQFKFTLLGGWAYSTSYATNFGYLNAGGPQITPLFGLSLGENIDLTAYVKFAIILGTTGSELGYGLGCFWKSLGITIDGLGLGLTLTDTTVISTSSLTINLAYRF